MRKLPKSSQLKLTAVQLADYLLRRMNSVPSRLVNIEVIHPRLRGCNSHRTICTIEYHCMASKILHFTITAHFRYGHPGVWILVEESELTITLHRNGGDHTLKTKLNNCGNFFPDKLTGENLDSWQYLAVAVL